MVRFTTAETADHLNGILMLQKSNLIDVLTADEMNREGFVTVSHSIEQLQNLNDVERHIIAEDDSGVVAYLLAMTKKSSDVIPVLIPMFDFFGKISYAGSLVSDFNYIVVGQACVDKKYRGQGILDNCYFRYKTHFADRYDFAITEIAVRNARSLAAHRRIGFNEVGSYISPDGVEWSVVLWDWKN